VPVPSLAVRRVCDGYGTPIARRPRGFRPSLDAQLVRLEEGTMSDLKQSHDVLWGRLAFAEGARGGT